MTSTCPLSRLALTRCDPETLDDLPSILADRLDRVRARLAETRRVNALARPSVGLAKIWALRHAEYRLEAEVAYLGDLLEAVGDIVADERAATPAT